MGSRFVASLLTSFLVTLVALASAGYAVTQLFVPQPRDVFRTGFFEFELAPGWECGLDGTEYVCQAPGERQKGAIAVIATKERGPKSMDSLQAYEEHLRSPKRPAIDSDNSTPSTVVRAQRIWLGGKEWVESLHFGSELPGFHTYYLATVTSHVGVLVTMSYREGGEALFLKDLTDMMATVRSYQQ